MTENLNDDPLLDFPNTVLAKWAPLLLHPTLASPECFVVGCIALNGSDCHFELANISRRIDCLFPAGAGPLRFSLELAKKTLDHFIAAKRFDDAKDIRFPTSNISLGDFSEAEGSSVKEIARSWVSATACLHDSSPNAFSLVEVAAQSAPVAKSLSVQRSVYNLVVQRNTELRDYFGRHIARSKAGKNTTGTLKREIDFSGRRLAANFATIDPAKPDSRADFLKGRLWDLEGLRSSDLAAKKGRDHELLLYVDAEKIDSLSVVQKRTLTDSLQEIENDAASKELKLEQFSSRDKIAERILEKEAA